MNLRAAWTTKITTRWITGEAICGLQMDYRTRTIVGAGAIILAEFPECIGIKSQVNGTLIFKRMAADAI